MRGRRSYNLEEVIAEIQSLRANGNEEKYHTYIDKLISAHDTKIYNLKEFQNAVTDIFIKLQSKRKKTDFYLFLEHICSSYSGSLVGQEPCCSLIIDTLNTLKNDLSRKQHYHSILIKLSYRKYHPKKTKNLNTAFLQHYAYLKSLPLDEELEETLNKIDKNVSEWVPSILEVFSNTHQELDESEESEELEELENELDIEPIGPLIETREQPQHSSLTITPIAAGFSLYSTPKKCSREEDAWLTNAYSHMEKACLEKLELKEKIYHLTKANKIIDKIFQFRGKNNLSLQDILITRYLTNKKHIDRLQAFLWLERACHCTLLASSHQNFPTRVTINLLTKATYNLEKLFYLSYEKEIFLSTSLSMFYLDIKEEIKNLSISDLSETAMHYLELTDNQTITKKEKIDLLVQGNKCLKKIIDLQLENNLPEASELLAIYKTNQDKIIGLENDDTKLILQKKLTY